MFGKIREKLSFYLSTLVLINASAFSGYALSQSELDEIVVTARKKAESLQDVPLSVSALRESSLEDLGVNVFEDYLLQLPSVTAGGAGPGTSTIYIRGLASTTPNLTTAGVGGLAPNVSFYLDEQPMAQPGRNLDVYAADIGRIEVLKGPQGTLFGASSQAGVVRMITNKPVIGEASTNVEFESRHMSEGENGDKVELVTNIPLGESTAARFVAYRDRKGGYIDQVAGSVDVTESARFRPSGTVRANGLPVSAARNGMQASDTDLSGITSLPSANAIVKDDVNEVSYEGFRLSLAHEINDNWSALATYANQTIETDGVFFSDPTLGDLDYGPHGELFYNFMDYADDSVMSMFSIMQERVMRAAFELYRPKFIGTVTPSDTLWSRKVELPLVSFTTSTILDGSVIPDQKVDLSTSHDGKILVCTINRGAEQGPLELDSRSSDISADGNVLIVGNRGIFREVIDPDWVSPRLDNDIRSYVRDSSNTPASYDGKQVNQSTSIGTLDIEGPGLSAAVSYTHLTLPTKRIV